LKIVRKLGSSDRAMTVEFSAVGPGSAAGDASAGGADSSTFVLSPGLTAALSTVGAAVIGEAVTAVPEDGRAEARAAEAGAPASGATVVAGVGATDFGLAALAT